MFWYRMRRNLPVADTAEGSWHVHSIWRQHAMIVYETHRACVCRRYDKRRGAHRTDVVALAVRRPIPTQWEEDSAGAAELCEETWIAANWSQAEDTPCWWPAWEHVQCVRRRRRPQRPVVVVVTVTDGSALPPIYSVTTTGDSGTEQTGTDGRNKTGIRFEKWTISRIATRLPDRLRSPVAVHSRTERRLHRRPAASSTLKQEVFIANRNRASALDADKCFFHPVFFTRSA